MLASKLLSTVGGSAEETLYVDDVFQTVVRTGTNATATITTGFQPDLVWSKSRSAANSHRLFDSARGFDKLLATNLSDQQYTSLAGYNITAFNSDGFSLGLDQSGVNASGTTYVDWVWKKAPKFFDCGTYTGNGSTQVINHALGVAPGMVIIKTTGISGNWYVLHRSEPGKYLLLEQTSAAATGTLGSFDATSITITDSYFTSSGRGFVWYAIAHDSSADGIVQCGSYTGNGGTIQDINLGWEPQYVLVKNASATADWWITDAMRGFTTVGVSSPTLYANQSAAETTQSLWNANATGFTIGAFNNVQGNASGNTYIYLAIRRPNKPPTTGTQVYGAAFGSSDINVGFPADMAIVRRPDVSASNFITSKLTDRTLRTESTAAESDLSTSFDFTQNGFYDGLYTSGEGMHWCFKRAQGVFDQVCYTGTGSARTVNHSLGVEPELMFCKHRAIVEKWAVYHASRGAGKKLNFNDQAETTSSSPWNNTAPTSSVFTLGNDTECNSSGADAVAYLFATKPGISKVGSYTGNGSSQTIDCGFTTGARFVLIKRTDSTGDWMVADVARGIVSGNDPRLSLNTTAAEVASNDWIDPHASGFIVNQVPGANANVNGATYIYLAYA